jgi:hypothetical protein
MEFRIASIVRYAFALALLLSAAPSPAAFIWEGASLAACYPGNQDDLSSGGCPCASNNECRATCVLQTGTCAGATGAAICSTGNAINASADGCACTSDNECAGNCNQTTHTCGGVTNGLVCSIGNSVDASANGCPCVANNECQGVCTSITDTCGGVAGAVEQNQPGLTGIASVPQAQLGASISDSAQLANGVLSPDGTIAFELYGPAQPTCDGAPVFSMSVNVAGNGGYASTSFVPTQVGTYRWVARYRGDAYNLTAATPCDDARQTVLIFVDLIFRNGFEAPPPQ